MSVQAPRSRHEGSGESESYPTSGKMSAKRRAWTCTCIDNSKSEGMYGKPCREHRHTGTGKETVSKADKATLVISETNIKLIKLNKAEYEQN